MDLWGIWSTPSLSLLPRSLCPGAEVPVMVPSGGQTELFDHLLETIDV